MDIKTLKQQKINEKLTNALVTATICTKEGNCHEICLKSQKELIEQHQKRHEELMKNTAQEQLLKETSRLFKQQLKRLEMEQLKEEKKQKAKDEFMKRYHAELKKDRLTGKKKFEVVENDLQWNSSAVKESEELFLQISREWGMNY